MFESPTVAVIGLGYVGLPLAVALARHFDVIGFDIDKTRVEELRRGHDRTGELSEGELADSKLEYIVDDSFLADAHIHIVTVPTPVGPDNKPDLRAVESASRTVGKRIKMGSVVVYESTVYPGVTEEFCGPILEAESGLIAGQDFYLGYSPERINPGDKVHRVDLITKVVAGQNEKVSQLLSRLYGTMNGGNIFIAKDIRTAEASKVIENAQRDINIAFVNEIAEIFGKMGISVHDVLEAAGTKWNFLPFTPGLVGGHCIGVDPYYLAHAAQRLDIEPKVILAGREINDGMAHRIADRINDQLDAASHVLVLGIAFKENVPDIRNSKVADLIARLTEHGHVVDVYDPMADKAETKHEYGIDLIDEVGHDYDAIVGAVAHAPFEDLSLRKLLKPAGLVADIKAIWRHRSIPSDLTYWTL
ncbi:nucleotide sugar dehydrogenase [Rhodospirillaceae bacterium KN72]|uniref:Nucleotide sugar dehydrogenase n=1 Tax=Pacificispira spongiicola TaxID=2729598 RepID=A0A7Y0HFN7_9PROT|nr:nucleotide sugar dehydrogenase [Pacificispira spongiicola]NMM43479.1 nucleotide sugar dehydrogenase [Pacificispira spongiicola]